MLVKAGRIADDPFTQMADGEPLPDAPIIVSLKRFLAEREQLLSRQQPLGVRLETAESPEGLGSDVHKLASVVLHVAHCSPGTGAGQVGAGDAD